MQADILKKKVPKELSSCYKEGENTMTNYIQKGDIVDYTNNSSAVIAYGDVIVGKDKVFVAAEEIAVGATGGVHTGGVFEFNTEDETAIAYGQKLYFNATSKVATATSSDNVAIGYAVQAIAASEGSKKVLVKLA